MKTMINIKADREVKIKAQKVAKDLGMPLSTVINAYLREFIRTKSVHFSLMPLGTPEGVLKPHVKRRLARIHKDIVAGKNLVGPFDAGSELNTFLDSLKP
jgi:addiction module RelB/DinJ family antitoxin